MRATITSVTAWFALAFIAACSGGAEQAQPSAAVQEQSKAPEPTKAPEPAPAPVPAAAPPLTPDAQGVVHLTSSDTMRFNATRIEVKAGTKVMIELKNLGTLPKEAMGHDLVVLKVGSDGMAFSMKAATAKATDYVPADAADAIIVHTKLLGPGETDTIEFTAPAAGEYPFLCSFPGHYALMNGVIVAS